MDFTIRPVLPREVDAIWLLVQQSVAKMNAEGNEQWGADYPTRLHYADDVAAGTLYAAVRRDGAILGVACINTVQDPTYAAVTWSVPGPAMVVHRMAVDPSMQRRGVADALFQHAEELACAKGLPSLRVDTYSRNSKMQALLQRRGYRKTGALTLHGRPAPFPCFEKTISAPIHPPALAFTASDAYNETHESAGAGHGVRHWIKGGGCASNP